MEKNLTIIAGVGQCGSANDHVEVFSPTAKCISQKVIPNYILFHRKDFGNLPIKYDRVWGNAETLADGLSREQAISKAIEFAKEKNIFAFLSGASDFSEIIYHPEGQRIIIGSGYGQI